MLAKKNISPELSLNDLREKNIDLIPKRAVFLMQDKEIDPSLEEKISVEKIAKHKNMSINNVWKNHYRKIMPQLEKIKKIRKNQVKVK